jgi:hypothetical protein
VKRTTGCLLDDQHYDFVIKGETVDVLKPDGSLLLALRPRAIPQAALNLAFPALIRAAKPTNMRPVAAGGAEKFRSGTVGYLNGETTAFARNDPKGWRAIEPLVRSVARVFKDQRPIEYQTLVEAAQRAQQNLLAGTAFTTVQVNRNARMAVHPDDGNLPGALGAMTVIRDGDYSGGVLVFPKFRVAVDLHSGDCLIADNQEAHGNTAIVGIDGEFERVSIVCYFHYSNLPS